ncbi:ABC transporter [Paenibacillus amylolyticus]|uniref:restriction system-associated AAA family ATPase n=1 Tax=Paenibacillus amylolyticus TaxID=1451 RepID=UPI00096BF1D5|nr:restriction system-associated AAA family ATPase [Paenibacillus amylolyticus]OME91846.1 ABC transporter [Paenibacillus amylolyticus]OMF02760.1 ABC transporter [Paenibacillus amylolyticus]
MKLLRLKITDPKGFRSLQEGFEVRFLREWNINETAEFNPYILAGPNGSGKSNVLEVLAAIFYHMESMYLNYRPLSFEYDEIENTKGFQSKYAFPNGFEIEYYISAPATLNISGSQEFAHIKIVKVNDTAPTIIWVNRYIFDVDADQILNSHEAKEVLPAFILGYSSGENEILSLPFFKMRFIHYDEYKDFLNRQIPYSSLPEGRLTFLNSEFNQAIVLSNLLLQEKDLLKPFKDEVGVEDIKTFRIIIKKYIDLEKMQITEDPENTIHFQKNITEISEDDFGEIHYRLNITKNLETIIQKLISCSTCSYYDSEAEEHYLDYWVNEETKKAFAHHFDSPIKLFQAFQILLTLNLFTVNEKLKKELYQSESLYVNETVPILPSDKRIFRFKDLWIQKDGVSENILSKSLSDGEHQFLHSLGLCLLYKNEECLYLLDEPETHFNPDWRAKFISRIRDCFKDKDSKTTLREMLITTHTPFLISDSKKEYVLIFNKLASQTVEVTRPDYNTLGASINKINIKSFGKSETIGGYAEMQLNKIIVRFEAGENKQELIDEVNNLLGDSVEKVLFINRVINSMEGK